VKAVILCGGMGTRIRDVSENLPKPMLPIGGRPIVWHIMKGFASHGVNRFVLCLGYKSWLFKEFFLNYRAMNADLVVRLGERPSVRFMEATSDDWEVTLAETGESTMTGGRLHAVRQHLQDVDLFFLTYGDGVSDIDLQELVRFHRSHGKIATVTAVRPPSRFGQLRLDGSMVREFNEKPNAGEGFINGGFFIFDARRIWDYLPPHPESILELGPMQHLVRDGQLVARPHEGYWQPVDTWRDFNVVNDLWARKVAPWKTWHDEEPSGELAVGGMR